MIYFLGGPPRVGKSIISRAICRKHGISVVSTDSLGAVLERVLDPQAEPGLHVSSRFNALSEPERIRLMTEEAATRLDDLVEESRSVWRAVEPFARREVEEGRDVVFEGVAVLPELVHALDGLDYRAVFIGYQASDHGRNIRRSALEAQCDWMGDASEGYVDAFARFVVRMSRYVEREARSRGFRYLAMEGRPFDDAVDRVAGFLMA